MTLEYELLKHIGKRPCSPNSPRPVRCPLVLNETSEDILTSNVFGRLKYVNPDLWLLSTLKRAFPGRKFSNSLQGTLTIEFWKKLPSPPFQEVQEGVEEIDIFLKVGSLVVLCENKYKSEVKGSTPSYGRRDQIARYIDAAVYNLWPDSGNTPEVLFLLITDTKTEPSIFSTYRDPETLLKNLTQNRPFINYPRVSQAMAQNIGWTNWTTLLAIMDEAAEGKLNWTDAMIIKDVGDYLRYKLQATKQVSYRQERGDGYA